ncbi:Arginine-glutamic acid dipeptide repeats protein [Liparis tanakae]|uniref:Arginine-glutamic acid dipeptide repeats protein n=1 Tax=Liparis tanakae TaxID=230148 RepID=A0A4Z2IYV6_9TELE|nr:Arginine-glutamic acid dipeptide repeats protein [Liparis tanakae]
MTSRDGVEEGEKEGAGKRGEEGSHCVYIESRRPNTPYFICSIQDFKLNTSLNVQRGIGGWSSSEFSLPVKLQSQCAV